MADVKPKLKLLVGQAIHFLRWELPVFAKQFELVDEPSNEAILFAFGPDVLDLGATLPCRRRVAMLFPGFGVNPLHDATYRAHVLEVIDRDYDLVFANPGPLAIAYQDCRKLTLCEFSVDTVFNTVKSYRKGLDSLIHVSADTPQKDWPRSESIMRLTGLKYEVYPPRGGRRLSSSHSVKRRFNRFAKRLKLPLQFNVPPFGYLEHSKVVEKYQQYDGFVHIAADIKSPVFVDGKYTTCLLEAGLTGCILFWHDTFGLGNTLETVFELPLEPEKAADEILRIRQGLDVERHSRLTREEILDRFNPEKSVPFRCAKMRELAEV